MKYNVVILSLMYQCLWLMNASAYTITEVLIQFTIALSTIYSAFIFKKVPFKYVVIVSLVPHAILMQFFWINMILYCMLGIVLFTLLWTNRSKYRLYRQQYLLAFCVASLWTINLLWSMSFAYYVINLITTDIVPALTSQAYHYQNTLKVSDNYQYISALPGITPMQVITSAYLPGLFTIPQEMLIATNGVMISHQYYFNQLSQSMTYTKICMLLLWAVSWGLIALCGYCAHKKKHRMFSFSKVYAKLQGGWLIILSLAIMHTAYIVYLQTGLIAEWIGVFLMYITTAILVGLWLTTLTVIINAKNNTNVLLTSVICLIIGLLSINSGVFDFLHTQLAQHISWYDYKHKSSAGFASAFSTTFLCKIIAAICLLLIVVNRKYITISAVILFIGAIVSTTSIWGIHHFMSAKVVVMNENLRENTSYTIVGLQPEQQLLTIQNTDLTIHDINYLPQYFIQNECMICKVRPGNDINYQHMQEKLNNQAKFNQKEHAFFGKDNVRLVDIMAFKQGNTSKMLINTTTPAKMSFIVFAYSSIVMIPLMLWWYFLVPLLVYFHAKIKK